jgi:hypothetical protein
MSFIPWGPFRGDDDTPETKDNYQTKSDRGETVHERDMRITGFLLDPSYRSNPPFDRRIQNDGHIQGKMPRGRIQLLQKEAQELVPGLGRMRRWCDFLFNPTTIAQSYEFSRDQPANPLPDDKSSSTVSGQTIGFDLYFNRMYELAYPRGGPASDFGVLADIGALENMVRSTFGRVLTPVPVLVTFGATWQGRPWSFYGWVVGMDVQYTKFTVRMIPSEAAVKLSVKRIYSGEQAMMSDAPAAVGAAIDVAKERAGTSTGATGGKGYWQ